MPQLASFGSGITLRRFIVSVFMLIFTLVGSATAADLKVTWLGADGAVVHEEVLTLTQLDALQQGSLTTTTPWNADKRTFTGPTFAALAALGPASKSAHLVALNDYEVEVPAEDWTGLPLVLVTRINGVAPPVYDKGPYWLMYPVDDLPDPLPQAYLARMIWQVKAITFHAS